VPTTVLNLTMAASPTAPGGALAGAGDLRPRALAVACFLGGAVTGGLLLKVDLWLPLALATLLSLLVGLDLSRERAALVDPDPAPR
jgi:hypothetical protein